MEWGAGSVEWGAGSVEWGAGSVDWGAGVVEGGGWREVVGFGFLVRYGERLFASRGWAYLVVIEGG